MNQIVESRDKGSIIESVLLKGDLSKLQPEERSAYYLKVCESVGLNPLTKPLEFIVLNGKMTLYALRGCTDQLRSIYNVSVEDMTESEREGVYVVTVKVRNGEGRTDMAKGAVNIAGLKGENLANAMMKAETKAKRRATLSLCGLGVLDETEVETIPNQEPVKSGGVVQKEVYGTAKSMIDKWNDIVAMMKHAETKPQLDDVWKEQKSHRLAMKKIDEELYIKLEDAYEAQLQVIQDKQAGIAAFGEEAHKIMSEAVMKPVLPEGEQVPVMFRRVAV